MSTCRLRRCECCGLGGCWQERLAQGPLGAPQQPRGMEQAAAHGCCRGPAAPTQPLHNRRPCSSSLSHPAAHSPPPLPQRPPLPLAPRAYLTSSAPLLPSCPQTIGIDGVIGLDSNTNSTSWVKLGSLTQTSRNGDVSATGRTTTRLPACRASFRLPACLGSARAAQRPPAHPLGGDLALSYIIPPRVVVQGAPPPPAPISY